MIVGCWSAKGGSGTSVSAAALAVRLAGESDRGALLVDLDGDSAAILGLDEVRRADLAEWAEAVRSGCAAVDALALLETSSFGVGSGDTGPSQSGLAVLALGSDRSPGHLSDDVAIDLLVSVLVGEARPVVIDVGRIGEGAHHDAQRRMLAACDRSYLVIRPCYLALRRASQLAVETSGVIVVSEASRALRAKDVAEVLGVPVIAEVPVDPSIARAVDSGLLACRMPRLLAKALRHAG